MKKLLILLTTIVSMGVCAQEDVDDIVIRDYMVLRDSIITGVTGEGILADTNWVNTKVGAITSFSNMLVESGGTVKFGGSAIENTTILGNSYDLEFGTTGNRFTDFSVNSSDNINLNSNGGDVNITGGNITYTWDGVLWTNPTDTLMNFGDGRELITLNAPILPTNWEYELSSVTTDSRPGEGFIRLNNATPANVTQIYIDDIDYNGASQTNFIQLADTGSLFYLQERYDSDNYYVYELIGGFTNASGYTKYNVNYKLGSGTIPFDLMGNVLWVGGGGGSSVAVIDSKIQEFYDTLSFKDSLTINYLESFKINTDSATITNLTSEKVNADCVISAKVKTNEVIGDTITIYGYDDGDPVEPFKITNDGFGTIGLTPFDPSSVVEVTGELVARGAPFSAIIGTKYTEINGDLIRTYDGSEFETVAKLSSTVAYSDTAFNVKKVIENISKTIYVSELNGDDITGDGTIGNQYQTVDRAVEDVGDILSVDITVQLDSGNYPISPESIQKILDFDYTTNVEFLIIGTWVLYESVTGVSQNPNNLLNYTFSTADTFNFNELQKMYVDLSPIDMPIASNDSFSLSIPLSTVALTDLDIYELKSTLIINDADNIEITNRVKYSRGGIQLERLNVQPLTTNKAIRLSNLPLSKFQIFSCNFLAQNYQLYGMVKFEGCYLDCNQRGLIVNSFNTVINNSVISGTGKTNTRTGIEITSGNVNLSDMIIQNFSHGIGLVDGATTVSFNAGSDLMFKNTQNAFLFRDGFNLSNGGVNSFVLDSSDYLYETVDTTNIVGIFDVNKIEGTPLISYVNTDNNKRWIPQNNYINYIQGFHTPKSELLQTSYIVADSGKVPINSMVAGVTKGFDITVADVWTTIKLDTIYEDLTTNLFRANSDSTGVILNKGATLSINGSAVMQNTTGGNITAAVYWRLLKNQVEISTFNISKERTYPANSFDFMNSLKSKVIVNTNDTLYIQVQVDNNNVDINSPNGVFDGKSDFEIDITEIHIK